MLLELSENTSDTIKPHWFNSRTFTSSRFNAIRICFPSLSSNKQISLNFSLYRFSKRACYSATITLENMDNKKKTFLDIWAIWMPVCWHAEMIWFSLWISMNRGVATIFLIWGTKFIISWKISILWARVIFYADYNRNNSPTWTTLPIIK